MNPAKSDQTLDEALDERRIELSLRWDDVATAAGISYETLRSIRSGRPMRRLSQAGIERALRLQRGSLGEFDRLGRLQPETETAPDGTDPEAVEREVRRKLAAIRRRYGREVYLQAAMTVAVITEDEVVRLSQEDDAHSA